MENVETVKYVRKPLYVDAIQVTAENFQAAAKWAQSDIGTVGAGAGAGYIKPDELEGFDPEKHYIRIRVNNPKSPRQTKAFVGDWILYTDRGFKIYQDKPFRDNFDVADSKKEEATT